MNKGTIIAAALLLSFTAAADEPIDYIIQPGEFTCTPEIAKSAENPHNCKMDMTDLPGWRCPGPHYKLLKLIPGYQSPANEPSVPVCVPYVDAERVDLVK